jgi:polysaccharide export outer membrane protein
LLQLLRPLATLLLGLFLATCAQALRDATTPDGSSEFAALPANANPDADLTSSDYRIGPRDLLQVSVFQVPDLNRTVQVNGKGFVILPLVGGVQVGGKTPEQAEQEIAAKLEKRYLRSPQVSVSIAKSGQRVTVNGAVKSPQVLTIDGRLTLSQAIAQTGGVNEVGNAQRIHVARVTGQTVNDVIFDLEAIQSGKAADPSLVGGDIVVAEESKSRIAFKTMKDLLPFAAIGAFLSDIRVKRDIVSLGQVANGLRLYRYRYAWSSTLYVGVMAQEVMEVVPAAVTRGDDGYLRVDYRQLGLSLQTWDEWVASNPTDFNQWRGDSDLPLGGDGSKKP